MSQRESSAAKKKYPIFVGRWLKGGERGRRRRLWQRNHHLWPRAAQREQDLPILITVCFLVDDRIRRVASKPRISFTSSRSERKNRHFRLCSTGITTCMVYDLLFHLAANLSRPPTRMHFLRAYKCFPCLLGPRLDHLPRFLSHAAKRSQVA